MVESNSLNTDHLVRQAALGPHHETGNQRWNFRTVEEGYVCRLYQQLNAARVRLINHPSMEFDEVPIAQNMAVVTGDLVLVEWIGGNQNAPVIVGLAPMATKERCQSTKRPMVDLVPLPIGDVDAGRHLIEFPLKALRQSSLVNDCYASLCNWEAHSPDGSYWQVFAQNLPAPATSYGDQLPQEFQRCYHQAVASPTGFYRQIPTADGSAAWRMSAEMVGEDLLIRFCCGGYKPGSVQDWEPHTGGEIALTMKCDGSLSISAKSIDFKASSVTINGQSIMPPEAVT